MHDRFLSGKPIAYMIYECFLVTGAHEAVLDFTDLFSIALHSDDIQEIDTRWDQVLMSTSEVPNDRILESLYKMRMRESNKLQTVLAMCEQEINSNRSRAELSKVEDHGKWTYRSKDQDTKISSQKRKN